MSLRPDGGWGSRGGLLGAAALGFAAAFAAEAIGAGFGISRTLSLDLPSGFAIAECLGALGLLILLLAAIFAAQAFLFPATPGRTDLRDAAALAAAGYALDILSAGFLAAVNISVALPSANRAESIFDGLLSAGLLLAAALVAVAFSRHGAERPTRDRWLGWAAVAFVVAHLFGLVSGIFGVEVYSDQDGVGLLTAGLDLQAAGSAVAVAAGTIAAFAFFEASGGGAPDGRRDLLLAVAAGVFAIFQLFAGIGIAIVAVASPGIGSSGSTVAHHWFDAGGPLILCAAAIAIAAALQPSLRRAIQSLA
jgi:hypothetical protein